MFQRFALSFLLLIISSVYLYTATSRAILDDGDALYATVARQMLERGDWVTPYADGIRFLDKPPMMYWLMAAGFRVFGISEFGARLPSALAMLGIGLLLFRVREKTFGSATGFAAGLAVSLCVGTFLFTRMVFPDVIFVFLDTDAWWNLW
jgi:4-amino-4-deoxy-L-arabinose transferase-like glycosyltransferase